MCEDIDLNIDLSEIFKMPVCELKRYYTRLYEQTSKVSNREFYLIRICYRLQELRFGGLSATSKGFIRKLYEAPKPKREIFPTGTVLVRRYKGSEYRVKILAKGVEMDNQYYTSLTSAAYKITGRRLSGRQFFGVKQ